MFKFLLIFIGLSSGFSYGNDLENAAKSKYEKQEAWGLSNIKTRSDKDYPPSEYFKGICKAECEKGTVTMWCPENKKCLALCDKYDREGFPTVSCVF